MRKTVAINEETHEILRRAAFEEKDNIGNLITKAVKKVYAKYL